LVDFLYLACYFVPYDNIIGCAMTKQDTRYGAVRSAEELGRLVRAHRKNRQLTLETVSGLANFSPRFLSEFERGKETAEIGKVLKALRTLGLEVIIQPRGGAAASPLTHAKRVNE
jgi:HTH-type transcriptional regulator/antitoxin HipB